MRSTRAAAVPTPDPDTTDAGSPGAEFRATAVARTKERRPEIDGPSVAFTLLLNRMSATHQHLCERLVHRPHGWTYSGFRVMFMIWLLEPVEARDLARWAGVSRQTTSTVLGTLESAGLITRKQTSTTDRRLVSVRLTSTGRRAIEEAIGEQNELEQVWFGALDEQEQRLLLSLLDRVLGRMHASTP
jgi:DNA-binding MarR family transcriptional regulator